MPWQPTTILRLEEALPTGSGVFRVVTDAGKGYLKTLGNPMGPRALASEWIAWHLARRVGLPTFEAALIEVTPVDELPFPDGGQALPGPAFITKAEVGDVWDGTAGQLAKLGNPHDLARLVVFDTWIRNRDRHPPPGTAWHINRRNVFISFEGPHWQIKAMDHSHCLLWGDGPLSTKLANIDEWQDERIYGRFPEFEPWVTRELVREALAELRLVSKEEVRQIVRQVPAAWLPEVEIQQAVMNFLTLRAGWLAENLEWLFWPQQEMNLGNT
jgi:hypothetical protein